MRYLLFAFLFLAPSASAALAISTTTCASGTQGAAYSGCTMVATGGTTPYTWSIDSTRTYAPLPEGMSLNASTGAISSSLIGGQGLYVTGIIVTDSATPTPATAEQAITFSVTGANSFMSSVFPSNSIFHHRVDAASTSLPVDTSPAAPIYSSYQSSAIHLAFGNSCGGNFPCGIPAIEVPYNQSNVTVTTVMGAYQSYFTSGPIPGYAPIEGTVYNSNPTGAYEGDGHVLVYQEAGGGNPAALWELFEGAPASGVNWNDVSNALWSNVSGNNLTPQGMGTTDAAGLPVMPLLENADEVIGTGSPSSPNGVPTHPLRFTLQHILNYWVWPGTDTSGIGSCSNGGGGIPTATQISQSSPPTICSGQTGPAGEIYRLKASVSTPSCAGTSPQAAIIITQMRNYGIILADNGGTGYIIGTPDSRWNDTDLSCLTNLTLANFEPVNVSSLIVSNDSGQTPLGSTLFNATVSGGHTP